jgi:hypothetical protein
MFLDVFLAMNHCQSKITENVTDSTVLSSNTPVYAVGSTESLWYDMSLREIGVSRKSSSTQEPVY